MAGAKLIGCIRRWGRFSWNSYFHCCGQSRLWIEKRYYDQIMTDVVETLSPPDSGNVDNLTVARSRIDRQIVTRGNIDLRLIRNGTPGECAHAAERVILETKDDPHLVAAADAILYGTPVENLKAIDQACRAVDPE